MMLMNYKFYDLTHRAQILPLWVKRNNSKITSPKGFLVLGQGLVGLDVF